MYMEQLEKQQDETHFAFKYIVKSPKCNNIIITDGMMHGVKNKPQQ